MGYRIETFDFRKTGLGEMFVAGWAMLEPTYSANTEAVRLFAPTKPTMRGIGVGRWVFRPNQVAICRRLV